MERDRCKVFFTYEDKKNLTVKKYESSEVTDKKKIYIKKRNKRRITFVIIIFYLAAMSYLFEMIFFVSSIAMIFMIFLTFLYEGIDRVNMRYLSHLYYVEIRVEKKLPVETCIEGTLTPGSDVTSFYPIEGYDTDSGYRSTFYVERSQYEKFGIGEKIKINIKGDKL